MIDENTSVVMSQPGVYMTLSSAVCRELSAKECSMVSDLIVSCLLLVTKLLIAFNCDCKL